MDLDQLDGERGGPLTVQLDGEIVTLKSARDLPWKVVAYAATDVHRFAFVVWPAVVPIPAWKLDVAHRVWLTHNGLPETAQLQRLVYMVQKYGEGIEYDLRHHLGVSLGDMWRDRQWREILSLIDRLPTDSHMNQLMTNDEQHLEEVLRRQKTGESGPNAPSMSDWSLTNSLLATLIDAVNRSTETAKGIANPKSRPSVQPYPRPRTAADAVRYRIDKERHDEMNKILLRNRTAAAG